MVLSFKNGKFILSLPAEHSKFAKDFGAWTRIAPFTYETTDFKAALAYRADADESVKRVFTRALVELYPAQYRQDLPAFLDSHQKDGVNWILTRSRSYLAHAPGAGKTAQAIIASLLCEGEGQTLFIVPPSLTINWEREIYKFCGSFEVPTVSIIPTSAQKQKADWGAQFIICPDSMLTREWVLTKLIKMKKKFVAVDEASRFKDDGAQRTIALFGGKLKTMNSPGLIQEAVHAVLLDGSPMPNRPIELWAPTYAMAPQSIDFRDKYDFGLRYCGATINKYGKWEFKHSSHEDELKAKLQKSFMHVVTEDQLTHPERRRSLTFMSVDVRTPDLKAWEKKHLKNLKLEDISEDMSRGDIAAHRNRLGLKKVPWIANYVHERLGVKNESILLFGWHRNVLEELHAELREWSPALVIGGVDEDAREWAFEKFQKGKLRLIIGNIAAMGRGHNLQRADRIIFGEYAWSDETNKQAEKRASRRGSDKDFVRCEYIVCPGSMDEIVLNAVFNKAKNVKRIIG